MCTIISIYRKLVYNVPTKTINLAKWYYYAQLIFGADPKTDGKSMVRNSLIHFLRKASSMVIIIIYVIFECDIHQHPSTGTQKGIHWATNSLQLFNKGCVLIKILQNTWNCVVFKSCCCIVEKMNHIKKEIEK